MDCLMHVIIHGLFDAQITYVSRVQVLQDIVSGGSNTHERQCMKLPPASFMHRMGVWPRPRPYFLSSQQTVTTSDPPIHFIT